MVVAPGAFDALSARVAEREGFGAVYMTGFGSAAALLGRPDVGLIDFSEMVGNARNIAHAVGVPVIADADTGYGGVPSVIRTVQEYARAGVAALHIEDQDQPKRCGHLDEKPVIPPQEMEAKVRAAVAASDGGPLIIARTDARAMYGMNEALDRAERYAEAGADVLFVDAPQSEEEIEMISNRLRGKPLLFNWVENGKTPAMSRQRLQALGFSIVLFPITSLLASLRAMKAALAPVAESDWIEIADPEGPSLADAMEVVGMDEIRHLEDRFGTN